MLKSLRIQNIILVENEELQLTSGLNILSGETGSGKSAIINSLALIAGERAEFHLIRHECEKATVEAAFDIENHPSLQTILVESGIEHEANQDLLIRREIQATGKSRAFVNNQMAQTSLLKKLGEELLQIVNQHANYKLFSSEYHREILDLFGDLEAEVKQFLLAYQKERLYQSELESLIQNEPQRIRESDRIRQELDELKQAAIKEGEDEELFEEFSRLTHSEETATKIQEILQALAYLPQLQRQKSHFESISQYYPSMAEVADLYKNALIELQEVTHSLQKQLDRLICNPDRLAHLNERLTLINKLKRKYGQTLEEIASYISINQKRLIELDNTDGRIENLKRELKVLEEETHRFAKTISEKRLKTAKKLEKELSQQLHSLNMPHAECVVSIIAQKRGMTGDDKVEFFIKPNKGEQQVSLKDGASGGEIARLQLALQTLLAGKERIPLLIFDEIDANIGGETAAMVGKKLKEISRRHQVICITHFPQVASQADHHLQISKNEAAGRTFTRIRSLDTKGQKEELIRMVGKSIHD